MNEQYKAACEYISNIPRFAAKTELNNTLLLLSSLGNPEQKYKSVHIAGTNGKGSVAKMTALMLEEAGFRVGLFISPHLVKMNERISVNGVDISDEDFSVYFEEIKEKTDNSKSFVHPAYFEFLFGMAAKYFADQNCDWVVWETGLGGRLDATNTIIPKVSVITSIGMDHMQYLGNTIEEIAGEKAGIIKPSVPVVYNTADHTADSVIEKKAKELGCVAKRVPDVFELFPDEIKKAVDEFAGREAALYQRDNAQTAVTAFLTILKHRDGVYYVIKRALERFYWPGRMEFLSDGILIDGAHNEDAAKRFVESVRAIAETGKRKNLSLVFAVSADKDYEEIVKILCENLDFTKVYVAELNSDRKTSSETVAELFKNYRPAGEFWDTSVFPDVKSAWEAALKEREDDTLLAVVGSLYLVGEIKGMGNL